MCERKGELVAAKEMADELGISFDFLAKTLQVLIKKGIVESQKGIKGGYSLAYDACDLNLGMVIEALGERPAIVDCMSHDEGKKCEREDRCKIKDPLAVIQNKIIRLFDETSFEDLLEGRATDQPHHLHQLELN
jgi:Rrf2 family nitric oxide-sensitive transcriptional repressor